MRRGLLILLAALVLAPGAVAGGPSLRFGATEDSVKQRDPVVVKAQLDLLRLAGFDSVRVTQFWAPGQLEPDEADRTALANVVDAASLDGIQVLVSVSNFGSRTTPLTDEDRTQFATFTASIARAFPSVRDFIIGNEPNLNRFWLPQFGPDGSDVAAPAYEALLAQTYDALKAVSGRITVIGGAVSPRGGDRPNTGRDTHSPTTFILDLGAAYRASGRATPIMDALAIHPYGDSSSQAPRDSAHPNTSSLGIADYAKLVKLLGRAFDGTGQLGSTLPVLYDEFGVETRIPGPKASLYTGNEVAATKPVDEPTQASYYRQALELSFCAPTVSGLFLFHVVDEAALDRWQSGLFYADDTPKSSLRAVRESAQLTRRGVIARCPGLELTPKAERLVLPGGPGAGARRVLAASVQCDIDCNAKLRLEKLPQHSTTAARTVRAVGHVRTRVSLPALRLAPGRYRLTIRLTAPVNAGEPLVRTGTPFRVAGRS